MYRKKTPEGGYVGNPKGGGRNSKKATGIIVQNGKNKSGIRKVTQGRTKFPGGRNPLGHTGKHGIRDICTPQ